MEVMNLNGGGILKLQQLYFANFRGIQDLLVDLSGKSTVFYGVNGVGKSSILRGVALLFSNIISRVTDNQVRQQLP